MNTSPKFIELFWWQDKIKPNSLKNLLRIYKRKFLYDLPPDFSNFGDELSPFIIKKLSNKNIRYSNKEGKILSVGSIIHFAKDNDIIWGSGLLEKTLLPKSKNLKICSVRGPLTKMILDKNGYQCPAVFGDPAILLKKIIKQKVIGKKYKLGIIPHWEMLRYVKKKYDNKVIIINT